MDEEEQRHREILTAARKKVDQMLADKIDELQTEFNNKVIKVHEYEERQAAQIQQQHEELDLQLEEFREQRRKWEENFSKYLEENSDLNVKTTAEVDVTDDISQNSNPAKKAATRTFSTNPTSGNLLLSVHNSNASSNRQSNTGLPGSNTNVNLQGSGDIISNSSRKDGDRSSLQNDFQNESDSSLPKSHGTQNLNRSGIQPGIVRNNTFVANQRDQGKAPIPSGGSGILGNRASSLVIRKKLTGKKSEADSSTPTRNKAKRKSSRGSMLQISQFFGLGNSQEGESQE